MDKWEDLVHLSTGFLLRSPHFLHRNLSLQRHERGERGKGEKGEGGRGDGGGG